MSDEQHHLEAQSPAAPDARGQDADPSRTEGAHVLASQARERLEAEGFDQEQIMDWAEAFVANERGGDLDAFLAWVEREQQGR